MVVEAVNLLSDGSSPFHVSKHVKIFKYIRRKFVYLCMCTTEYTRYITLAAYQEVNWNCRWEMPACHPFSAFFFFFVYMCQLTTWRCDSLLIGCLLTFWAFLFSVYWTVWYVHGLVIWQTARRLAPARGQLVRVNKGCAAKAEVTQHPLFAF